MAQEINANIFVYPDADQAIAGRRGLYSDECFF